MKLQYTLRRKTNLLPLRNRLYSSSCTRTDCGPDGCPLAATRDAANQSANRGPAPNGFRCPFTARGSLPRVFVRL